jgi:tRNA U54 and U55 pseudouridine synthase Pus10
MNEVKKILQNFKTVEVEFLNENNEHEIYICVDYIDNEADLLYFELSVVHDIEIDFEIISSTVREATFEDLTRLAKADLIETDEAIKKAFLQIARLFTE